ncbi:MULTISPECIES: Arc family DNA-binding protein [unclassified Nocardiopsis]|uniref:Arc family DNA-binding protein n=1 Tax=unclassified Nocardiopsis TaxID=2649073 RepID=UPI0013580FCC|nr:MULTISPECIES: Arc family DNA-binding protein [unclassified Nocardiopsis]
MSMHVRLPEDIQNRIRAAAEEDGNSVNTEVVVALTEFLQRRQTERVRQYALEIAKEDAELLARLAE